MTLSSLTVEGKHSEDPRDLMYVNGSVHTIVCPSNTICAITSTLKSLTDNPVKMTPFGPRKHVKRLCSNTLEKKRKDAEVRRASTTNILQMFDEKQEMLEGKEKIIKHQDDVIQKLSLEVDKLTVQVKTLTLQNKSNRRNACTVQRALVKAVKGRSNSIIRSQNDTAEIAFSLANLTSDKYHESNPEACLHLFGFRNFKEAKLFIDVFVTEDFYLTKKQLYMLKQKVSTPSFLHKIKKRRRFSW